MKTIKTLLFLLTVLGLTACKQVSITAPTNNFVDDEKPAAFALTFTGGAPTDLQVQLNTSIVTDRFAVTTTGATATGDQLADVVYPGRNILRVTANKMVKQIAFYYDTEGPTIRILDTDHSAGTVSGKVIDRGGIASVVLDGVAVSLNPDNSFSVPFSNQPVNRFEASDNFGHTSVTEFARKDTNFTGISARLNQGGFDFLITALRGSLENQELTDYLQQDPKLTLSNFNILGACILCIDFTVSEFKITKFNDTNTVKGISLNVLDNEQIDTNIDASAINMLLKTNIKVLLLSFKSDAKVTLNRLQVKTKLLLDIKDSDLDIDSKDTNINITGLAIDLLDIPNWFGVDLLSQAISLIANGLIGMIDWMLGDVVDELIVPIASDFIKDIPINLQLVTLDDGETLNIRALPQFLDSANNGVTVDLNTRIWAPLPNPAVPGALGSLYVEGETPSMGHLTPDGQPFHFGASISSNVINQALFAAHEAGVTTMEIRPEIYPNATPEGIQVYALGSDFGEGAKIGMRIEPASAPYIKFMPSEDGAPGKFGWSDVYLAFDLYKPEWGEYRTLFGVTFDLEVPFEINTTDDGFLSIGIEQLPTIFISKTDSSGMLLIPPAFINGTLDYFMPVVMPVLAQNLKVVPLPRIYNHTLHMEQFWIAGSGYNNLSLAGSLIPLAETAAAAAPTTIVDYDTQDITVQQETVSATGVVTSTGVTVNNGEVIIDVDGINPNPERGLLEHRYRVDGGGWSVWKHRNTIRLNRLLAGDHTVEVCGRTVLLKREQSCPVVQFTTTVN